MRKMRYFAGSFWTPDTDTWLQRLEAQGLSAAKIAAKLGVSRNSVSEADFGRVKQSKSDRQRASSDTARKAKPIQ